MTRALLVLALLAFLLPSLLSVWSQNERDELGHPDHVPSHDIEFAYSEGPVATYPPGVKVRAQARFVGAGGGATVSAASSAVLYDDGTGFVNGYPCGGDLPWCSILACESGGNPAARNPRSSASGLWQILASTWAGFGGFAEAWQAPADVQNEKARLLWAGGDGAFHWRSCW